MPYDPPSQSAWRTGARGVKFHDLLTVSLGGKGTIAHVINTTGGPAQGTNTVPVYLVSFP